MLPLIDNSSLSPLIRGILNSISFLLSLVLLERSADVFVDSTAIVAKRLGISTVLVGLLTAGAEWEELAVVVSSLTQHHPDLAISNILGSCTANILGSFSIGLCFARTNLTISAQDKSSSMIYSGLLVVVGGLVALFGPGWGLLSNLFGRRDTLGAGRWAGISLLVAFAVYVGGIVYGIQKGNIIAPEGSDSDSDTSDEATSESEDEDEPSEESGDRRGIPILTSVAGEGEQSPLLPRSVRAPNKRPVPTYRHIAKLVLSAALLTLAGILLSSTTSSIADLLHITRSTAGLTILSIATTLPEKLVAFKSGRKAQAGVLVANTVGSNVFLLTLVLGVVWTAQGHMPMVEMGVWIWFDVGIVLVSSVVLFIIILSNALKRWMGSVMFGSYVLYIIAIFLR